jgi:hypothetical protein
MATTDLSLAQGIVTPPVPPPIPVGKSPLAARLGLAVSIDLPPARRQKSPSSEAGKSPLAQAANSEQAETSRGSQEGTLQLSERDVLAASEAASSSLPALSGRKSAESQKPVAPAATRAARRSPVDGAVLRGIDSICAASWRSRSSTDRGGRPKANSCVRRGSPDHGSLEHPSVVPIHELGVNEGRFFTMSWCAAIRWPASSTAAAAGPRHRKPLRFAQAPGDIPEVLRPSAPTLGVCITAISPETS